MCAPVWAPSAHEWSLQGGGPRSREPAGLHPWEPHTALLSACRGPFPQGSVPVYETWTAPTGDGRRGSIPHAGDRHQGDRKTSVIAELMAQGCRGAAGEQRRMAMYPPSGHTGLAVQAAGSPTHQHPAAPPVHRSWFRISSILQMEPVFLRQMAISRSGTENRMSVSARE